MVSDHISTYSTIFSILNQMKREGVITDWVLFGSVAFIYYDEVILTRDIDVIVGCNVDEYDNRVRPYLRSLGRELQSGNFEIGGRLLQVIPSVDGAIWQAMLESAHVDDVNGEPVKIASPELLIVAALKRFDYAKDFQRVVRLHPLADKSLLIRLLKELDTDGKAKKNYGRIRRYL